jgi:hypothetical protein
MIPAPGRFPSPARFLAILVLLAAAAAPAAVVGDSYDKVIAEKGSPRSQMQAGTVLVLSYPDVVIRLENNVVVSVRIVPVPATAQKAAAPAASPAPAATQAQQSAQVAEARAKIADALAKARAIINQPVPSVAITDGMQVVTFPDGWFHPGAGIPAFSSVDIQATQDVSTYEAYPFVSSNLTPGVAFAGKDCEFNSMTKFLYTNRSLPKKRLTPQEMQEVNRLYHIVGTYSAYLRRVGIAWSPTDSH